MKGTVMPLRQRDIRAKMILMVVIPALIPFGAILFYNVLPTLATRYFLFTKGWVAWTLIEYCMHRWTFNRDRHDDGKREYPYNHNHHHAHPDNLRLNAMHRSIGFTVILASLATLFTGPVLLSYIAGLLSGGALYILMHWFLHRHFASYIFPSLVRQHIWHHCKYPNKCYGVTSTFWDKAFKTLPAEFKTLPEKVIRSYYKHEGLDEEVLSKMEKRINASGKRMVV